MIKVRWPWFLKLESFVPGQVIGLDSSALCSQAHLIKAKAVETKVLLKWPLFEAVYLSAVVKYLRSGLTHTATRPSVILSCTNGCTQDGSKDVAFIGTSIVTRQSRYLTTCIGLPSHWHNTLAHRFSLLNRLSKEKKTKMHYCYKSNYLKSTRYKEKYPNTASAAKKSKRSLVEAITN